MSELAKVGTNGQHLTWFCKACGLPIGPGTGGLGIDQQAVSGAERLNAEAAEARRTSGKNAFTVAELLEGPDDVPWEAFHTDCDPDPDGDSYWIDINRIDTFPRLVHWAGHLGQKPWIEVTDWHPLLMSIGEDV